MINPQEIPNVLDLIREQEQTATLEGLKHLAISHHLFESDSVFWSRLHELVETYKRREGLGRR